MKNTIEEIFNKDFHVEVRKDLEDSVMFGMKTFGQFMIDNKNFFTYDNYGSLKGELLVYCVNKSVTDSAFTPRSLYQSRDEDVNDYGRGIVHLHTENFLTTVNRTRNRNLPGASKYRKEYAKANSGCDGQLTWGVEASKIISGVVQPQYYAILTYGYRFDNRAKGCTHIQLLVPDENYKQVLIRKDLLDEYSKRAQLVDVSEQHERQIMALNEGMEQLVKLKESK